MACNCPTCQIARRPDPGYRVLVTGTDGKERVYKNRRTEREAEEALGHFTQPARIIPPEER